MNERRCEADRKQNSTEYSKENVWTGSKADIKPKNECLKAQKTDGSKHKSRLSEMRNQTRKT